MPLPDLQGDGAEHEVATYLRRVSVRLRTRQILLGVSIAASVALWILVGAMLAGFSRSGAVAAVGVPGAVIIAAWTIAVRARWSTVSAAEAVERARPDSRNVVITARELIDDPRRGAPWVRARVFADARRATHAGPAHQVVPLVRTMAAATALLATCVLVAVAGPDRLRSAVANVAGPSGGPESSRPGVAPMQIAATIQPPAYLGARTETLEDPQRIEAIQGSRLTLAIRTSGRAPRVRFGSRPLSMAADERGIRADVLLTESGYFAIENDDGNAAASRRLLPVIVTPDRAPAIRVVAPGKDLLLPNAAQSVAIASSADDDHGLAMLELRYTKVSGSGEQFQFEEGVLPLDVRRASSREWTGAATLALGRLGLAPGDSLVYRVVGRDGRPGDAGFASSDTFFVEIAGPGQVALAGVELPPDRERYALSQQMIVLKIERLRARERGMAPQAIADETAGIAAEQRAVRSNFIFLLGGQVEDEFEEAEHSHEIQEGRLENTARKEINQAIHHMGGAEQALAAVTTAPALKEAKAAVEALQRAFGRNRYILRTLPVRSKLDPARRLSGELEAARDWRREAPPADAEPRAAGARAIHGRLLANAPGLLARQQPASEALAGMAEDALRVDPASKEWQAISAQLQRLREAVGNRASESEISSLLNEIIVRVAGESQRHAVAAPRPEGDDGGLRGAWADAQQRRGAVPR